MSIEWTDAEREAVMDRLRCQPYPGVILGALAGCRKHREPWTPEGCPVAIEAAAALAPFVETRIRREFAEYADALRGNESAQNWTREDYANDAREWGESA